MNTQKPLIAPSILSADFGHLNAQVKEAENHGADWIHIDVMDGQFVPNLTFGPIVVAACRRATNLPLDVHLMIEQPERLIDVFAQEGANSITIHYETCPHLHRTIEQIHNTGCKAGVAINPATPKDAILPVLAFVDLVVVMSVNPGFSGQSFIPQTLEKVRFLRTYLDSSGAGVRLQMDGGISEKTITAALGAGADVFVAGSAVFNHPEGIRGGMESLRQAIV